MAQNATQEMELSTESSIGPVVRILADDIQELCDPDHIVGVARGGLPLAVRLSHELDVPMSTVSASHYDGREREDGVRIQSTDLTIHEEYSYNNEDLPKTVVIVDDICDSGETLGAVKSLIERRFPPNHVEVYTATWVQHDEPVGQPDVAYRTVDDDVWTVFPWE